MVALDQKKKFISQKLIVLDNDVKLYPSSMRLDNRKVLPAPGPKTNYFERFLSINKLIRVGNKNFLYTNNPIYCVHALHIQTHILIHLHFLMCTNNPLISAE